jgi:hypothetical protein
MDFDIRESEDRIDPPPVSEVEDLYTTKSRVSSPFDLSAFLNQWPGVRATKTPLPK